MNHHIVMASFAKPIAGHSSRSPLPPSILDELDERCCQFLKMSKATLDVSRSRVSGGEALRPSYTWPKKLHAVVHVASTSHERIVQWRHHGKSFIIWNKALFVKEILQLHFDYGASSAWESFTRQMRRHKIKYVPYRIPGAFECYHPYFSRDDRTLLNLMKPDPDCVAAAGKKRSKPSPDGEVLAKSAKASKTCDDEAISQRGVNFNAASASSSNGASAIPCPNFDAQKQFCGEEKGRRWSESCGGGESERFDALPPLLPSLLVPESSQKQPPPLQPRPPSDSFVHSPVGKDGDGVSPPLIALLKEPLLTPGTSDDNGRGGSSECRTFNTSAKYPFQDKKMEEMVDLLIRAVQICGEARDANNPQVRKQLKLDLMRGVYIHWGISNGNDYQPTNDELNLRTFVPDLLKKIANGYFNAFRRASITCMRGSGAGCDEWLAKLEEAGESDEEDIVKAVSLYVRMMARESRVVGSKPEPKHSAVEEVQVPPSHAPGQGEVNDQALVDASHEPIAIDWQREANLEDLGDAVGANIQSVLLGDSKLGESDESNESDDWLLSIFNTEEDIV